MIENPEVFEITKISKPRQVDSEPQIVIKSNVKKQSNPSPKLDFETELSALIPMEFRK